MTTLWQDLRFALRSIAKKPVLTLAIILSLSLAIGANTSIFTFFDTLLLRPLPFDDADRLIRIRELRLEAGSEPAPIAVSHRTYAAWKARNRVFADLAAQVPQSFNIIGAGEPEHVPGAFVSANYLSVLGVRPILGRDLLPDEDQPGNPASVVLISHSFWARNYGSDPGAVGQDIVLDQQRYTVIGVLPPRFKFPYGAEMWVPMPFDPLDETVSTRRYLNIFGRLKPNVPLERARREMEGIAEQLAAEYPTSHAGWSVELKQVREDLIGEVRSGLFPLFAAAGFVLLICCVNVANLLLARAVEQGHEVSIRVALGANRRRVLQQMLTQSTLLALLSGAVGVLLALVALRPLVRLSPLQNMDAFFAESIRIDLSVLGFTLVVSLVTGILFGLLPALYASKTDLRSLLLEGSRSATGHHGWMNLFVVCEMALTVLLLASAGLVLKSFQAQQRIDLGFDADRVLTMQIVLSELKYPERTQQLTFYDRLIDELKTLPGIVEAGVVNAQPFSGERTLAPFVPEGYERKSEDDFFYANHRVVSPGYLETMGIRLLRGRTFLRVDCESGRNVVIVSKRFADAHWGDEDPLQKRVRVTIEGFPWMTVIGVVGDVEETGDQEKTWYVPYSEDWNFRAMNLLVRTDGVRPIDVVRTVRQKIWDLDPEQAVFEIQPMTEAVADFRRPERFSMMLFGYFGILGLVLASVGIYGVMAYSVSQRFREFGIRIAMGAQRLALQGLVLRRALLLTVLGVAIGTAGALALTRFLSSSLYAVSPHDPATFITVALTLTVVAAVASCLPAWRAARVDPAVTLREQ